ncbi:outer membrane pore protein [Escherichia coli]|nr:outer membrane pore protein [Escherichia coli]GCS21602.1 outer membrane pore protein [Escherichia coli]
MKYNNVIFLGLCLGLTTYSALSADSVIKISGRVLDYWICPYISRHLLSLNPLQARCRRYSRGER